MKRLLSLLLTLALTAVMLCSCNININIGEESSAVYGGKGLSVHFLDVGQGDSIFAELPNGETMLVDAADNYYGMGIIKYIEKAGYSRIDYLVATHPHADHIGSMAYVVRNFDVRSIMMPKVETGTVQYESLLKAIENKKLKIKNGRAGVNIVKTDDFTADVIAPDTFDANDLNNCSLVIKLTCGKRSFLLTGDAGKGVLNGAKDLQSDVLKAGHHGSKTSLSRSLLEKISPDITVISCGKNNDYGHPHKEVLEMLADAHSTVYRTDKDKTVIISTDGNTLTVSTDNPSIVRDKK